VVRVLPEAGDFSFRHRVLTGSGAQTAYYAMDTRGSIPGGKTTGHEADHSPPSSAEVKNAWNCNSTSQYAFMECCIVEHIA
jgi:hypothetical protein